MDASKFFDKNGNFKHSLGSDVLSHSGKRVREKIEGFFQAQVTYNRKVKVGFRKYESIPFIFTSNLVFLSKEEAIGFLPFYIRKLIQDGDLPEDAVKHDIETGKEYINQALVVPQVMKLTIGAMEDIVNQQESESPNPEEIDAKSALKYA